MKKEINIEEVDDYIIELLDKSFFNAPTLINVIFKYNHNNNINFLIIYNYCKANNISFTYLLKEYIINILLKQIKLPSNKIIIIRLKVDIAYENSHYESRFTICIYTWDNLIRIICNERHYYIHLGYNNIVTPLNDQDWIIKKVQKRFNHELSTFVNTIEKLCRCNKIDVNYGNNN